MPARVEPLACWLGSPALTPAHWTRKDTTMNERRNFKPFAIEPFDDASRTLVRPWKLDQAETAPRVKIDVTEQEAGFAVKAGIPGVRKEDIDGRVDGNPVTISAEVKTEKEEKEGTRVLCRERQQGFASRTFTLGCPVDEARADAKVESGVLNLSLPKKASASTRRLVVTQGRRAVGRSAGRAAGTPASRRSGFRPPGLPRKRCCRVAH